MDHTRFDRWTMDLTSRPRTRRRYLAILGSTALSGLVAAAGIGQPAAAATCKKVDESCRRPGQCCSGICRGKKGRKTCRGHGRGTCKGQQSVCTAPDPALLRCNNATDCTCDLTTSGTSFCADRSAGIECANCRRDTDCRKLGYPDGSACIVVSRGRCAGSCETGRACVTRCGVAPPPA